MEPIIDLVWEIEEDSDDEVIIPFNPRPPGITLSCGACGGCIGTTAMACLMACC